MTKCSKCNAPRLTHLWIVHDRIYCSPRCERGKEGRFADKTVDKIGVAGFVRETHKKW